MKKMLLAAVTALTCVTQNLTANYIEIANKGTKKVGIQLDEINFFGSNRHNFDLPAGEVSTWNIDNPADLTIWSGTGDPNNKKRLAGRRNLADHYRHYIDIYDDWMIVRNYHADNTIDQVDVPIKLEY